MPNPSTGRNYRIHYGIYFASIEPTFTGGGYTPVYGLQNFNSNADFGLQQFFEIGQLAVYQTVEDIPNVQCTLEKVLDGTPPISVLASQDATAPTLAARSNTQCDIAATIYDDDREAVGDGGTLRSQMSMPNMYLSNISFTFPVQGASTESVTFEGDERYWLNTSGVCALGAAVTSNTGDLDGSDTPYGNGNTAGISLRQHVLYTTDPDEGSNTILPTQIDGINSDGTNIDASGNIGAHIQNISVSVDFNRTEIFELGRKTAYFRYADFPVQITTEIEVLSSSGDLINACDPGAASCGSEQTLSNEEIRIATCEGTRLYLGTQNKLQSITFGGADTGGGNATATYSYITFNTLYILHEADPNTVLRPSGAVTSGTPNYEAYLGASTYTASISP